MEVKLGTLSGGVERHSTERSEAAPKVINANLLMGNTGAAKSLAYLTTAISSHFAEYGKQRS